MSVEVTLELVRDHCSTDQWPVIESATRILREIRQQWCEGKTSSAIPNTVKKIIEDKFDEQCILYQNIKLNLNKPTGICSVSAEILIEKYAYVLIEVLGSITEPAEKIKARYYEVN